MLADANCLKSQSALRNVPSFVRVVSWNNAENFLVVAGEGHATAKPGVKRSCLALALVNLKEMNAQLQFLYA
jgi:hypothetical protein